MIKSVVFASIFLSFAFICRGQSQQVEIFDEYFGKTPWNEEIFSLDNFAGYLRRNPDFIGYIAYYVGQDSSETATKRRALRAKQYLIRKRAIRANRIVVAKAGTMPETMFVLQPAPKNAPPIKWQMVSEAISDRSHKGSVNVAESIIDCKNISCCE
jgi:hypothetical protein